jgi:TolB-like protein
MKLKNTFLKSGLHFVLGALTLLAIHAGAAETNSVRIAIGPFFAPAGNAALGNAAAALPDLLMVSLSQENRFQLVEREKVNAIWNEMHLAEAGLTSADTVGKLGKILSCDWLVSGSLVPAETGPQVWVKIIDTQSSVVLDLESLPYNSTNFSATAKSISDFLAQAKTRAHPREFIALEKFEDRSVSSTREDWTPRLTALIEKHFLAAGYGVVERESVSPIFSEYQLQSAGMTADAKRVKLKPAFWVVAPATC